MLQEPTQGQSGWCSFFLAAFALVSGVVAVVILRRNIGRNEDKLMILCYSWLTMLSTGLGSAPFFFFSDVDMKWLGISNAIAAGMMLAASIGLIAEGYVEEHPENLANSAGLDGTTKLLAGFLLGILFMIVTNFVLKDRDVEFQNLRGASARKALLILAAMAFHSIAEGVAIGVSFGSKQSNNLGLIISSALGIHNVPEGLAVSLTLVPKGVSPTEGMLWSIMSSFPQPLFALPSFIFVKHFVPYVSVGLGFAAGSMATVSVSELIPEALSEISKVKATFIVLISGFCMGAFQYFSH